MANKPQERTPLSGKRLERAMRALGYSSAEDFVEHSDWGNRKNDPLSNVAKTVRRWMENGVPANKLNAVADYFQVSSEFFLSEEQDVERFFELAIMKGKESYVTVDDLMALRVQVDDDFGEKIYRAYVGHKLRKQKELIEKHGYQLGLDGIPVKTHLLDSTNDPSLTGTFVHIQNPITGLPEKAQVVKCKGFFTEEGLKELQKSVGTFQPEVNPKHDEEGD